MKRFHVHVGVADLDRSIRFYETLFGAAPTVVKPDYAKWMLEDPRVNFAISSRAAEASGLDHVGLQADDDAELAEIATRLKAAGEETFDQTATACCYARSNKTWVKDPSGLRWETFHTFGEATTYGEDAGVAAAAAAAAKPELETTVSGCCGPA